MASVSTGHAAVGVGVNLLIKKGRSLTYSVLGTHSATVRIERSDNSGASWDLIQAVATTATIAPTTIENNTGKDQLYRSNCTVYVSGTATALIKDATEELIGTGTPGATSATLIANEYGTIAKKTVLECNALSISISDDAGVAQYGGVKVYDFPEGMLMFKGAQLNGTLTAGVTGTVIDNWDGDVALGTVTATTGATLVSTEADFLTSTAVSAGASDKDGVVDAVSIATVLTESGARWMDGTTTAKDMYLNFVIDDDASHDASTATFTGTIVFNWEMLGDN